MASLSDKRTPGNRVVFIGIGDLLHRDRGIGLYLMKDLKRNTANTCFSFLKLASGAALYSILQSIKANKFYIFECGEGDGHPGELAVMKINKQITFFFIEPFDTRRGNRLSRFISLKYPVLLKRVREFIGEDLRKEGLEMVNRE